MKKPPFDIVVLRHWREKSRDTNSGQLVTGCIAGARVVDMVDESYKNLAAHLPKGNVWLLFPESIDSAGNVVVPTHRGLPDPLPKTIVVVDGTWAEAQRMAKALPGLPRLVPQGGPRASERLLAPPQAGAMATAEAIAALIAEVDPYAAACLDRAYARHVTSLKKGKGEIDGTPARTVANPLKHIPRVKPTMKRNPVTPWLVSLKSQALEGWISHNEPRLLKTSLSVFDSSQNYGFAAPAVDRSFVVSASNRQEAIQRGLAAFNTAAAKSYSPISAAAIERADPGPVYLAEVIRTETGETNYFPFTRGTAKDVEAFVRKQYLDPTDVTVKAAAYSRSPDSLARSFVPGTAEHEAYLDYVGAMEASVHEEMEEDIADATENLKAVIAPQRGEIQTVQQSHMDLWSRQAQREYLAGAHEWTTDMVKAYESSKEQDFIDAQMNRNSESRRRELGSVRLASLSADLAPVKPTPRISGARHVASLKKSNPYKAAIPIVSGIAYYPKENPLVGFERVTWKPSRSPRLEATFLSTAYPRLWEEALKNTELKIRVLVARDEAHMGDIGKNLMATDAEAKRAGEVVILLLPMESTSSYAFEGMIGGTRPGVGGPQRLSRPTPFMILHNLAEELMMEEQVAKKIFKSNARDWDIPRSPIDPARVDTWAGRRGALKDWGNALADLFAKYVTTGKVAYTGTTAEISAIKKFLDTMVDYLKRNPGVYEAITGKYRAPASDRNLKSLSTPAPETRKIPIDSEELLENPTDLAGRHVPDRYLAGLPAALQKQRVRELTESRDAYKMGDYSELPTDRIAREMGLVKQSQYTTEAKKRGIEYRGDLRDMAQRVMAFYGRRPSAREVEAFAEALRASFAKGLAAWKSGGHRPGATAQNWAVARVNSLVVGGKTSWTADKKLFEVLPESVRAKIESMRQKQNPISVEVRLDGGYPAGYGEPVAGKHTRFLQSGAAMTRIVEQGKEVVPRIKFVVDWDKNAAAKRPRIGKGERGVITLVTPAATFQSRADDAERGSQVRPGGPVSRNQKVSLYTAHTILHRLGDRIMPRPEGVMFMSFDSPGFVDRRAALVVTARVESAWRLLGEALAAAWNHTGGTEGLNRWLTTVVDTKACREGWVTDGQQAMAELVPYRLLYKKGREHGVKLMSDLPFVPRLEKAFTNYIDACMDQFTGQEIII